MHVGLQRWISGLLIVIGLNVSLGEAQVTPAIQLTSVPAYGTVPGWLSGRVVGINPSAYNVAALVFVSGLGFYSKPYCNATTTPLGSDGSFNVLLTTGGIDQYATLIAVLVVPATATVPCYTAEPGVPSALEQQAVAETLVPRPNPNQREIQFAGETWVIKSSPAPVGPGPNYFSDSQDNVSVDNLGRLHLRITNRGGLWYCAEIISKRVIGYGQYTLQIETAPQFDKNVVFGAFSWADAERNPREIDMLELGRFGNANDPNNAQNVVQPYTTPGNQMRFPLPVIAPTMHKMTWLPGVLNFQSSDGFGAPLHQWTYGGQPPSADSQRLNFRLNLWLFAPPSDGKEAEVVVSDFSFFSASPFGFIDTPINGSVNQAGAINFTGWALSHSTVAKVALCREPVTGEAIGADPNCLVSSSPTGLVFLGSAVLVPGVRPDVATAFPGYPNNNWGWGAQILTNYLPGTNGMALGNGTYKLHAIAADPSGVSTDLGTTTISANNAASILPFGTIDTPGQGQTVSGTNYINFGWVVTPQPNIVPIDGSTITVHIDGVAVGRPTYNNFRSDIATLFPGLRNTTNGNGGVGYFPIDTTRLSNGIHNIDWVATDSAGHTAGIGSRNFFVSN